MSNGEHYRHRANVLEIVVITMGLILSWVVMLFLLLSMIDRTKVVDNKIDRDLRISRMNLRLNIVRLREAGYTEEQISRALQKPVEAEFSSGEGY